MTKTTKKEKAKAYHDAIIAQNPQAEAWGLDAAWLAGYDTAQKEFLDDILEHNKDVLERLKNNVPPSTLTWQDIELIVTIADMVLKDMDKKELLHIGKENYYKQVLYQFSNSKSNA